MGRDDGSAKGAEDELSALITEASLWGRGEQKMKASCCYCFLLWGFLRAGTSLEKLKINMIPQKKEPWIKCWPPSPLFCYYSPLKVTQKNFPWYSHFILAVPYHFISWSKFSTLNSQYLAVTFFFPIQIRSSLCIYQAWDSKLCVCVDGPWAAWGSLQDPPQNIVFLNTLIEI